MELGPELADEVLASLGEAVVEADLGAVITGWHAGAEALFGYTAGQMVGRPLADLFTEAPVRDLEELTTLAAAGGVDVVVPVRRRLGDPLPAAVSLRQLPGPSGPVGMLATIRPMVAALDPVRGRAAGGADWERTLGGVVRGLVEVAVKDPASLENTDTVARVVVEHGRRMLRDTECLLSVVPHDRQELFEIIAGSGEWGRSLMGRRWTRVGTVAGLALERQRPIETLLLAERSNLRDELASGQIVAGRLVPLWTALPLPDGRTAVGVLGFYRRERRYFSPYERRLIGEFGRLASLLLQGAELRAVAARNQERLLRTVDAAYRFTRSLAPSELMSDLATQGIAAGAVRSTLLRVDDGRMQALAAAEPGSPPVLGPEAAGTDAPAAQLAPVAAELGRLVVSEGPDAAARHLVAMPVAGSGADSLPPHEMRAFRGGPGAVVLAISRPGEAAFAADELALLQTVAGMAGVALRNAALYEEVQEASLIKTEFLNMAAHELRTPLTVIRGYLSMLQEGSFGAAPDGFAEPMQLLHDKTEELGRLVDDLLLAARLDGGRVARSRRPIDLNQVVREVADWGRGRPGSAGIAVRVDTVRRPVVVDADPAHVLRILEALVANALAFVGRAEPAVRLTVRARDGRAQVEVEDRGRGIAETEWERIFERFQRLDDERYPQRPGTGLGLYIARALAERQGGQVTLEWSVPDKGSRFLLSLPELETGSSD